MSGSEAGLNAINLFRLLVGALAIAATFRAVALSTDTQQPVEIEADFAEMDDQEGRTTYIGNVVVVQGSIRMTGDRLRANFDDNRQLVEVYLDGQPAYFKQTPDGGKEDIEGEATHIQYFAKKNVLVLIQDARLKQGARLFEGYKINYDTKNSVITGRGTPKEQNSKDAGGKPGRIRIIIPPKTKAAE